LIGSGHFQANGAVFVHLDDKNLPPADTSGSHNVILTSTIKAAGFDNDDDG
jgi:hypothetical protein